MRIDTSTFENFRARLDGYDAELTWLVEPTSHNPSGEKWHFRMLEGPMANGDDYYCVEARFLTLQRKAFIRDKSLTKGLPNL